MCAYTRLTRKTVLSMKYISYFSKTPYRFFFEKHVGSYARDAGRNAISAKEKCPLFLTFSFKETENSSKLLMKVCHAKLKKDNNRTV